MKRSGFVAMIQQAVSKPIRVQHVLTVLKERRSPATSVQYTTQYGNASLRLGAACESQYHRLRLYPECPIADKVLQASPAIKEQY